MGLEAREHRCMRGQGPGSRGDGVVEDDGALGGPGVDAGSRRPLVAVEGHAIGTNGVERDQEDVGPPRSGSPRGPAPVDEAELLAALRRRAQREEQFLPARALVERHDHVVPAAHAPRLRRGRQLVPCHHPVATGTARDHLEGHSSESLRREADAELQDVGRVSEGGEHSVAHARSEAVPSLSPQGDAPGAGLHLSRPVFPEELRASQPDAPAARRRQLELDGLQHVVFDRLDHDLGRERAARVQRDRPARPVHAAPAPAGREQVAFAVPVRLEADLAQGPLVLAEVPHQPVAGLGLGQDQLARGGDGVRRLREGLPTTFPVTELPAGELLPAGESEALHGLVRGPLQRMEGGVSGAAEAGEVGKVGSARSAAREGERHERPLHGAPPADHAATSRRWIAAAVARATRRARSCGMAERILQARRERERSGEAGEIVGATLNTPRGESRPRAAGSASA